MVMSSIGAVAGPGLQEQTCNHQDESATETATASEHLVQQFQSLMEAQLVQMMVQNFQIQNDDDDDDDDS